MNTGNCQRLINRKIYDGTKQTRQKNFLTWYRMATPEDIEKARTINNKLYEELLAKHRAEVEAINLKKGTLKGLSL